MGSLLTVIAWSTLGFHGWGGFGTRVAMSWLLSSILSTPLALLIFAIAQTAATRPPHHLHKRILLTHDLGAIATLGILYLAMGPTEFAANPGGEALILGIVYPVVGTIAWRKFLEFSSR